jgi:hypothetical protein
MIFEDRESANAANAKILEFVAAVCMTSILEIRITTAEVF